MWGWDIAVAGCGPSGLAAALLLHRQGNRVVLFDRFPTPRPLGSGLMLQPTGMAVLGALGLADKAVASSARIARLYGLGHKGNRVLDARYSELPGPPVCGHGIHRASLFDLLYDEVIAAGIEVVTGRCITGSVLSAGNRWLEVEGGPRVGPFALVIDALGLHTLLAPPCGRNLPFGALWASLPWPKGGPFRNDRLEQRYRAAREMIGVLPTGCRSGVGDELSLFWSLPADSYESWRRRGLAAWKDEVATLWPECGTLLDQITDAEQLTMARYAHRTLRSPAQERMVHIGDAWHTASPQLGQGANMALLDAWAVAEAMRISRDPLTTPGLTVQLRAAHVALYQWVTALFTPMYQSNSAFPAWLRDRLLAPASRLWPGKHVQAMIMSGQLGAPLRRLGLVHRGQVET